MDAPLRMMSAFPRVFLTAAGFTFSSSITSSTAPSVLRLLPTARPVCPLPAAPISSDTPTSPPGAGRWLSFRSVLRGLAESTGLQMLFGRRWGELVHSRRRRDGERTAEPAAGRRTSTGLKLASSVCSIAAAARSAGWGRPQAGIEAMAEAEPAATAVEAAAEAAEAVAGATEAAGASTEPPAVFSCGRDFSEAAS